jgi:hypothetical protein
MKTITLRTCHRRQGFKSRSSQELSQQRCNRLAIIATYYYMKQVTIDYHAGLD